MEGTDERQRVINRYTGLKKYQEEQRLKLKRRSNYIAGLRLVLFVGSFFIPFAFIPNWTTSFFVVFTALFLLFLSSVFYAHKLSQQLKTAQSYLKLYTRELQALHDNWTDEPDGAMWIDPNHDFAHDLDLFGKGSLFQFINRTATKEGGEKLAQMLQSVSLDANLLQGKQKGLEELASLEEFREQFYVSASLAEEKRKKNKEQKLTRQPDLKFVAGNKRFVILLFPFVTLVVLLLSYFSLASYSLIIYTFLAGLAITGFFLSNINHVHNEVTTLGNYLTLYSRLVKLLEKQNVQSPFLVELKAKMGTNGVKASKAVHRLGRLTGYLDQRLNMLMGALLNGFFLWDLILCIVLQKWYSKYGDDLTRWMETLFEVEALNSLATFNYNHPHYCQPQFSTNIILNTTGLGHPLIPVKEKVSNDFSIEGEEKICVITGANMAGKSTFLRTVGVNLVLAGNGCRVSARRFVYKPLPFLTNMRAIDNLLRHESYFFAELSRLQMIVERLKSKGEVFFILDEILKGTNSHDKTAGSMALIQQLLKLNGSGIIATHDLELGELANQYPGQIFNNCFEVTFENDTLNFDYRLREGITKSHNASFLLHKMGLIPDN